MAGIVITGTDTDGIVLSDPATADPATADPATITATGFVINQTVTHNHDAIFGDPGYSWTARTSERSGNWGYTAPGST